MEKNYSKKKQLVFTPLFDWAQPARLYTRKIHAEKESITLEELEDHPICMNKGKKTRSTLRRNP